ncbi:MAG: ABC transporter substrate-binding protein [Chitinophagaceae bacterium]|nr:ABC transporter substrate-binding protein [Chitinophagaceae bacterium]
MQIVKKITSIFLIIILLAGCNNQPANNNSSHIRIVSLSKHLTEMLFALGEGSHIVATDLTSSFPDSAKLLKKVGYHRSLNAEGIAAMKPDLVIHSNDIGPVTIYDQIKKLGLHTKVFGAASTIDSCKLLLSSLGNYFNRKKQADSLVQQLDSDLATAATMRSKFRDSPTVMVIHFGQVINNYFVMTGRKGAADQMIQLAGGKIALYDGKGARQLSGEAVAAANPDIIIATDLGFDKMGSVEAFKTIPGVAFTKAAKTNKIFRFEEHDLVYFGPRSGKSIQKLVEIIHGQSNETK